jgi:hypothetical protein
MRKLNKCTDCVGFCNFGEFPSCKPSVKKEFDKQKKNKSSLENELWFADQYFKGYLDEHDLRVLKDTLVRLYYSGKEETAKKISDQIVGFYRGEDNVLKIVSMIKKEFIEK